MNIKNKIALFLLLSGTLFARNISEVTNGYFNVSLVYDIGCDDIDKTAAVNSTNCVVPAIDTMVPQGLAIMDNLFFISFYDYSKEVNSCINVLDFNGNILNECVLDNKAHVGGIAIDKNNNLLWVCGSNGSVNAYNLDDILNKSNANSKYSDNNVGDGLYYYRNPFIKSASFLTIKDNQLFVGNFSLNKKGKLKRYTINSLENESVFLEYEGCSLIPDRVQGITFYEKDGNDYILFSRSYGVEISSLLQVFCYNDIIYDYNNEKSISLKMPTMMEQIIVEDSSLFALFESMASPYRNRVSEIEECVVNVDIDNAILTLEVKKDTK